MISEMVSHLGKEGGHGKPVVDGGENSVCVHWYVEDDIPGKKIKIWNYKNCNSL